MYREQKQRKILICKHGSLEASLPNYVEFDKISA